MKCWEHEESRDAPAGGPYGEFHGAGAEIASAVDGTERCD